MAGSMMAREWLLEVAGGFKAACVLGGAAELGLFDALGENACTAEELAGRLRVDLRGLQILLDAAVAVGILEKQDDHYATAADLQAHLTAGPESALPMIRHQMCIQRSWTQLAAVVQSGRPATPQPSVCGAAADRAAFVAAMHTVSGPIADPLVAKLRPLRFTHLLDVGGASGTWTLAFLRAVPQARATIFDLPDAVEQARARIEASPCGDRITLAAGDFYADELPGGVDYAWVSAIIHQHSREQTQALFAKVFRALQSGGMIGVRDVVMEPDRTRPAMGALFAVNMLVNTATGMTYTFAEIAAALQAAGFVEPRLRVPADDMSAVVEARKP